MSRNDLSLDMPLCLTRGAPVLLVVAGVSCNALWGVNELDFAGVGGRAAVTSGGAAAGVGGVGGTTTSTTSGSLGGADVAGGGGTGGEAGAGGAPAPVWLALGERDVADITEVTFDSSLEEDHPTIQYGTADGMWIDQTPNHVGLIRFDLSSVPTSSVVIGAELRMVVDSCSACFGTTDVQLFELLESWDEDAANWQERAPNIAWSTAGAGLGSRAAVPVATMVAPFDGGTEHSAELSASLVQGWLESPSTNFGLTFVALGGDGVRLHTREAAANEARPLLVIALLPKSVR